MADEIKLQKTVLRFLDRLDVPYENLTCDPRFADTANFCREYGYPAENSGNTIIVASRKEPRVYAACVVRSSVRLDVNKTVRRILGGPKLSFASGEETQRLTGMALGGVTPFALPEELPILVDEGLMQLDYVILGGGGRSSKVKIPPAVFQKIPQARVITGLALPVDK